MEVVLLPVWELCVSTCRIRENIFLFVCKLAMEQIVLKVGVKKRLPYTMYFSQRTEPLHRSIWSQPKPIDILTRIRAFSTWASKKDERCGSNGRGGGGGNRVVNRYLTMSGEEVRVKSTETLNEER